MTCNLKRLETVWTFLGWFSFLKLRYIRFPQLYLARKGVLLSQSQTMLPRFISSFKNENTKYRNLVIYNKNALFCTETDEQNKVFKLMYFLLWFMLMTFIFDLLTKE